MSIKNTMSYVELIIKFHKKTKKINIFCINLQPGVSICNLKIIIKKIYFNF